MKVLFGVFVACLAVFSLVVLWDIRHEDEDWWNARLVSSEGIKVTLEDFRGQYVLLHFWNTWCPPCRKNLMQLDKAYEGLSKYMLVFAVTPENPEPVRNFLKKNKITMPVFLDVDGRLGKSFGIQYVPSDRVINRAGKIVVVNTGPLDWVKVLKNIQKDGGIREDKTTQ